MSNNLAVVKKNVGSFNVKNVNIDKSNFERKPTNAYFVVEMDTNEMKSLLGGRISGRRILEIQLKKINYPKYFYSFINVANDMSGATSARKVGTLHTYFSQKKFRSLNEWKKWYNQKHPNAIKEAVETIYKTIEEGTGGINRKDIKKWIKEFVENLIYEKTYSGLKIQEIIFKKMAQIRHKDYRWGSTKEDSSGIDGYIGEIPVCIKPDTCDFKKKAGTKRMDYTINKDKMTLSFTFSY